jgi:spermidine synthase
MFWCTVVFAVSMVASTIGTTWTVQLPVLIGLGVFPYVFVGIFLSLLFEAWPAQANRLYFLNLVGSGVGCLGLLWVLHLTGNAGLTVFLIAALALVAAALLAETPRLRWLPGILVVVLVALVPLRGALFGTKPAPEKGLAMLLNDDRIESEIIWSKWGYLGRMDLIRVGEGIEHFPFGGGQVRNMIDAGCDVVYLFAAGGNWTKAIHFHGNDEVRERFVDNTRHSLPYILTENPTVLNIGFGGGVDVFLALAHDAKSVVGVDINPLMIEGGRTLDGYFEDFYDDPRVTIEIMDGRTFVRTTDRKFDVVSLTAVDTGELLHSNAHVLLENYLYTQEAFDDYFSVLDDDGYLYVSRPYQQMMRTIVTAIETLRHAGVPRPEDHFAVLGEGEIGRGTWRSVVMSKQPLTAAQERTILRYYGRNVAYLPSWRGSRGEYTRFFDEVRGGREQEYLDELDEDITPVSDDRPFFYEFSRSLGDSPAGEVLFGILIWVSTIAAVLILLPLVRLGSRLRGSLSRLPIVVGYFLSIGAGFMFLEIGLIQKLVLYLGHPSYSVTVTLFSILVFSGLGSLFAQRFTPQRARTAMIVFLPILAAGGFYALGLGRVLPLLETGSLAPRVLLVGLLLAPGSFFMGMPFPTMVRMLEGDDASLIPWGWAVNSFTSVATSVVSVIVAMQAGFTVAMSLGVVFYLLALLFFLLRARQVPAVA